MNGVEVIYQNCTVHTMDDALPQADAFLVRGERIAAVGSREEVDAAAGANAKRVNLEGQSVIPGFNDSHCHIMWLGLALDQIDVGADAVRTIEDIRRVVAARVAATRPGEWVAGRGYDQNTLAERRHPTRLDLDETSPNHPAVLRHTSGHVLTCNSRALAVAGVTASTDAPFGGEIDRDAGGEPTGLMKEAAMELIEKAIPLPTVEISADAIARAMRAMARFGITSASDAATGGRRSIEPQLDAYRRAAASRGFAGRITLMPQIYFTAPPESRECRTPSEFAVGENPDRLAIGATKIFSDGALSTRTAALREPYGDDPNNSGILLWERPVLEDMVRRAHAAGWQIATHALGDRAVEAVVDAYERAVRASPGVSNPRHRIEHCMFADESLARRIRHLGAVPSLQPDIFRLGDGYVAGLGLERASQCIPVGLFRRLGVPMAFSSDAPVIPCDPLPVIRSAVERKTPRALDLGREHAATVMEAIRLYTLGGAYATHGETSKGRISPGMLADFAVLSADPSGVPIGEFDRVQVTMTVVGGVESFHA
jgi:predicted amidohydrolase YtcJ